MSLVPSNVSPNLGSTTLAGGAWLAEMRLHFPRRATKPCVRPRDGPQHGTEAAVRPAMRMGFRGGGVFRLRLVAHSALTRQLTTLRGALHSMLGGTRRAHISHLCCFCFLTRTPEVRRLSPSTPAQWHPRLDHRGAARQPSRHLFTRRCARGSARHAHVESSSACARCSPNMATPLNFCASPPDARRQWPHLRGRQVRCTLGMLRSGDTPASTRNSLAGQGTRAPGPAKTGSRPGGRTENLHGSGAECAVVCVANRPQALAPGRTRHCHLKSTKRRLWVSTKPAQRHSGRDAAASEDSTRRPEGP